MGGMAPSPQPLDLGILLALAFQEFVRELHHDLAGHGFTDLGRSDGVVFRALGATPMTLSELAQRLDVSKQAAGQIVDDMQRRGYVVRRPDPHDGRARRLHLSERGRAALAAARRFHQRYERRLVDEHGTEPVSALRAVLTAMAGDEGGVHPGLRAMYG